MSPQNLDKNSEFISLSEAVMLVTYSRDYIGRLAREGKILSRQINKQWFINRQALFNFFEQSALEDSVKKRILSLNRKNDLEVKIIYADKVAAIKTRSAYLPNASLFATVVIVAAGLFSGVLLQLSGQVSVSKESLTLAFLMESINSVSIEFSAHPASVVAATLFTESQVIETEEKITMENGLVLFSTGTTEDKTDSVIGLFSDEVEVVLTSTTTGHVKMSGSEKSLPFVRVPKESKP